MALVTLEVCLLVFRWWRCICTCWWLPWGLLYFENILDIIISFFIFLYIYFFLFLNAKCCFIPFSFFCSSQSRADLLTLGLAVTCILNGLVWLSIRPKSISVVRRLYPICALIGFSPPFYPDVLVYVAETILLLLFKFQVNPEGVECQRIFSDFPDFVISELLWYWSFYTKSSK